MPFPKGQNPNHPTAGSTIKVEPIRDKKAIQRMKKILAVRPRDLCGTVSDMALLTDPAP